MDSGSSERGLRIFGKMPGILVEEARNTGFGARCWLWIARDDQCPNLGVEEAEQLAAALLEFARAARAGELTEKMG